MPRSMVIETFRPGCKAQVYHRFHAVGRMLPPGLVYLDSWLERDGDRCFQLMAAEDPTVFPAWTQRWDDLVAFEIIVLGDKPAT